jgi:hypothetical protein
MTILDGKTLIGWGTIRETPWHFVELFGSMEEAQAKADAMGPGYIARYGERQEESDTFALADVVLPTAMVGSIFEPLPTADDTSGRLEAIATWIDDHLAGARAKH